MGRLRCTVTRVTCDWTLSPNARSIHNSDRNQIWCIRRIARRWRRRAVIVFISTAIPMRLSRWGHAYMRIAWYLVVIEKVNPFHFYSASALLAMQSAVLARGIPSVRLSVCPSVTFRYCVQTNELKIQSCGFQHLVGQSLLFLER